MRREYLRQHLKRDMDLFLDSGAFSALSQGVDINIDEYILFIKEHLKYWSVYSNLDVIGDPEATYKNQKYMESKGLNPLPCFHYGTDEKYLRRYLKQGYQYIALGGMVPITTHNLIPWLDSLFLKYFTDTKGWPLFNIHGFGISRVNIMIRYPWYSVDSTSWVATGRFGSIYVPKYMHKQYIYTEVPYKIAISNKSTKKEKLNVHYATMNKLLRQQVDQYLEIKGYTANELAEDYIKRDEINIIYFLDLEKNLKDRPFDRGDVERSLF